VDIVSPACIVVLAGVEAVSDEVDLLFAIEEATASALIDVVYEVEVVLEDVLVRAAIHSTSKDPLAAALEGSGADVTVIV